MAIVGLFADSSLQNQTIANRFSAPELVALAARPSQEKSPTAVFVLLYSLAFVQGFIMITRWNN